MKLRLFLLSLAALSLSATCTASAENLPADWQFSSESHMALYQYPSSADSSSASFFYNDGEGRMTIFEMRRQNTLMTVTVRQFGAVVWEKEFTSDSNRFAVSRHADNGRTWFTITVGDQQFDLEPDEKGLWHARPAHPLPADAMIPLNENQ